MARGETIFLLILPKTVLGMVWWMVTFQMFMADRMVWAWAVERCASHGRTGMVVQSVAAMMGRVAAFA